MTVGEQGEDDQRHVEDEAGQIEHALGDVLEVGEEAQDETAAIDERRAPRRGAR